MNNMLRVLLKTSLKKKIAALVILLAMVSSIGWKLVTSQKTSVQYETTIATKGTLITSISGTGSISSGNNTSVTTKVSGVVNTVYVTNGDKVVKGQKIADVSLDDYALERQTAAWVSYLEATEAVNDAVASKVTTDINMWNARQAVLDAQEAFDNKDNTAHTDGEKMIIDKTLDQTRKLFTAVESKYLHADADIANSRAKVAAALRDYQENSSNIVAPATGTISDLMLAPGIVVNANSSTSSTTGSTIVSSQTIGKISNSTSQLIASVSLSEIDIVNVKANQKVTLTIDAFSDKTFTGKVLAVDTSGTSSSGVTTYPVTILLDPVSIDIYPKMAVSANIITSLKTDVITVPSTAISISSDGSNTVQIMKNGKPVTVSVQTGTANDSDTEIISGIAEGDVVVTSVVVAQSKTSTQSNTTSPFSTTNSFTRSTRSSGATIMTVGGPPGF
jgi:multidrug efflux pump subunit AcrA (membrane-fusion protein)